MKIFFSFILFLWALSASAQFTLRLNVVKVATKHQDDIYVAGTFNNWNPQDYKYKLKPLGTNRKGIILKDLPPGKYEFKFTRGTDKWETTGKGEDIANREILLTTEDVIKDFSIEGWKDDYPDKPKPNTASAQVIIDDASFAMPQLNRKRRIWMYLPKSYFKSNKTYPVVYMHDGQNLFNEQTAPFGEWGVDEALDSLYKKGLETIIVGIDNGGSTRLTEYNPYDHSKFGKGEGKEYVDFIVKTLKPYIDKKYRTKPDSSHTFIAGSSMGALISQYAIMQYPSVFGGAGIFSPSFMIAPVIFDEVSKMKWLGMRRFYFYAGGQESFEMVPDMDKMISIIESKGKYATRRVVDPVAKHNEAAWRKELTGFFEFILRQ